MVIAFYLFDVLALGHRIRVAYINYPRVESYLRMHRPRNMKDSHRIEQMDVHLRWFPTRSVDARCRRYWMMMMPWLKLY